MLGHRKLEVEDYLGIWKRRRTLILATALLFPLVALAITFFLQPKYLSQTLVLVEEQKVPDEYVKPVISSNLDTRLASMKEQILSRSRIIPIIERYNLYGSRHMNMDDRIDNVRKNIDIKPIHSAISNSRGLPGFFVSFIANDARTAQLVCGDITSLFLNENTRSREASAEGTTDFLKGQLADAKRTLDEQDAKLAAFQRQFGGKLPTESGSNLNMLTSLNTQLEAATQALARMEQDKSYAESMLAQQVQERSPIVSSPGVSPEVTEQAAGTPAQQAELQSLLTQQADMASHYTEDYPDVIAIHRKIAELRKQMTRPALSSSGSPLPAASRVPDSPAVQQLKAQLRSADVGIQAKRREQEQIQSAVRMYQGRIESSPQVEEQYKELTRDYDTAHKFYDDLLTKMNHSKMATDLELRQEGEQFRVMDQPNLPDAPTFPKRWMFGLGGLLLGLAVGGLWTAWLEYKDTSLRSERDVWSFTKLPTLATISIAGEIEDEEFSRAMLHHEKDAAVANLEEDEKLAGAHN